MDEEEIVHFVTDCYVSARYWLDPVAVQRLEEIAAEQSQKKLLADAFLVVIYFEGWGIMKDKEKACALSERCCPLLTDICTRTTEITPIVPCAKYLLGKCFRTIETDESMNAGFDLIAAAAGQNYVLAICEMGDLYSLQTSRQDHLHAVEMYLQAIELGFDPAFHKLGICYFHGDGLKQSYERAFKLFQQGAELGIVNAFNNVAECYFEGSGVDQNYETAVHWYLQAAQAGDKSSQYSLAHCFRNGLGTEQNLELAIYWCEKSANQDDVDAMMELATMFLFEPEAHQHPEHPDRTSQGVNWIKRILATLKLDKETYTTACRILGKCLLNGLGVAADPIASLPWFVEAFESGNNFLPHLNPMEYNTLLSAASLQGHRVVMRRLMETGRCDPLYFSFITPSPVVLNNYYSLAAEMGLNINNQKCITSLSPLEFLFDLDLIVEFPSSPDRASFTLMNAEVNTSLNLLRVFLLNGFETPPYEVAKIQFTMTAEEWLETLRVRGDIIHAIIHLEF